MGLLEIIIAIVLLAFLPAIAIKFGAELAKNSSVVKTQRKVISDIEKLLTDTIRRINSTKISSVDITTIKMKKEKLIIKLKSLLDMIAIAGHFNSTNHKILDNISGEHVDIQYIEYEELKNTTFYPDYSFVFDILKSLIQKSEFPKKEHYSDFNKMYKKYKSFKAKK